MEIPDMNRALSVSTVVLTDRKIVRPPLSIERDTESCTLASTIRQPASSSPGILRLRMRVAYTPREHVGLPIDS